MFLAVEMCDICFCVEVGRMDDDMGMFVAVEIVDFVWCETVGNIDDKGRCVVVETCDIDKFESVGTTDDDEVSRVDEDIRVAVLADGVDIS